MFDIKPGDLISKTDILLFEILGELQQLNKSLRPIAKDTGTKKKPKPKVKNKVKPKQQKEELVKDNQVGGGEIVSSCTHG